LSEDYGDYLEFAGEVARRSGEILEAAFGRVSAREKGPSDLITDADLASQRSAAAMIAGAFPDHTLLAEEEGAVPDPSKAWRWVIDPLDGTVNFAHGVPLWCVSVALEHRGELVVGVVHSPPTRQTFAAAKGRGATLNGAPIRVSGADRLSASLIASGMPTAFAADADRQMAWFRRLSTGTHSVRRTGTTAWNLAMVAAGGFDVCYGSSIHPWDAAAGVVLIREAGGTVTGLDGSAYDLYGLEILASNGRVHDEARDAIVGAWPPATRGGARP
jgi:myo-inositol-1(or 4)-monophosphatase